jgi:hypothetical protein
LTPAFPIPIGLLAVIDPRKVVSVSPSGHFRFCDAGWEETYTNVVVPVSFHVMVLDPDVASTEPGKVPDPPVAWSCEHELMVIELERLPLTVVQIAVTLSGGDEVVVVAPAALASAPERSEDPERPDEDGPAPPLVGLVPLAAAVAG